MKNRLKKLSRLVDSGVPKADKGNGKASPEMGVLTFVNDYHLG